MTGTRTKTFARVALVALLIAAAVAFYAARGSDWLTFEALQAKRVQLAGLVATHPIASAATFAAVYVAVVVLALPGAAVMSIAGGALFGLWRGAAIVVIAATIGATLSMLVARFVARDWVKRRFPAAADKVDRGFADNGPAYLLTLRLAPAIPFFVINLAMGLTAMPVGRYALLTAIGILPGTFVFVSAGTALAQVKRVGDIFSPTLLLAFLALAIVPLLGKWLVGWIARRKALARWSKPRRFDANLIVIGAGSAGLVASYAAAAAKARVILIEQKAMGGDCLNTGCVPSKALIRAARAAAEVRGAARFGIDADWRGLRFAGVVGHMRGAIAAIAPHDSVERFTGLGVDVRQGTATFVDPWTVMIDGGALITARAFVIATGADPVVPQIPGLEGSSFVTSETLWDRLGSFAEAPGRVVILGGGAIGCEIAQALARLGSQVALVEQGERILVKEEPQASAMIAAALERDGVRLLTGFAAESVADGAVLVSGGEALPFDLLVVAVGRKPRVKGLGLDALGLEPKALVADGKARGPFAHWFVAGDVGGGPQFTHFAGHSGAIAGLNGLVGARLNTTTLVPRVTYTSPEVAAIGLLASEAPDDAEIVTADIADNDRDIADAGPGGTVQLIIRKSRVLGVTIVAEHAGEMIVAWQLAMAKKVKVGTMLGLLYPYPTRADAAREAANHWRQAHQPQRLLKVAERWFAWRRGA